MDPIFDRDGNTAAWRRKDVVFSLDGTAIAFVFNRALFALDGAFAGRFEDGVYRDPRGRIAGFERDATGVLVLPTTAPVPVAPPHQLRPPVPVFAPIPSPPPMRSLHWSEFTLAALIASAAASDAGVSTR